MVFEWKREEEMIKGCNNCWYCNEAGNCVWFIIQQVPYYYEGPDVTATVSGGGSDCPTWSPNAEVMMRWGSCNTCEFQCGDTGDLEDDCALRVMDRKIRMEYGGSGRCRCWMPDTDKTPEKE